MPYKWTTLCCSEDMINFSFNFKLIVFGLIAFIHEIGYLTIWWLNLFNKKKMLSNFINTSWNWNFSSKFFIVKLTQKTFSNTFSITFPWRKNKSNNDQPSLWNHDSKTLSKIKKKNYKQSNRCLIRIKIA